MSTIPSIQNEDLETVSELALSRLAEAVRNGTMTLDNGQVLKLEVDELVDVCKSLATIKMKKPKLVTKPEDFKLNETGGEGED